MREAADEVDCPILRPTEIQQGALLPSLYGLGGANGSKTSSAFAKLPEVGVQTGVHIPDFPAVGISGDAAYGQFFYGSAVEDDEDLYHDSFVNAGNGAGASG
jgi:hypothetical protein